MFEDSSQQDLSVSSLRSELRVEDSRVAARNALTIAVQMDYDFDVAKDTSLRKIKKEVQNMAAA
jgi:hypothetical protein